MTSLLTMKRPYFLLIIFIFLFCKFVIAEEGNNTYNNIYEQFLRENNIPIYFIEDKFIFAETINEDDIIDFLNLLYLSSEIIINNIANATTTRTNDGGPFIRNRISIINGKINILKDNNFPPRLIYDPTHPDAIQNGDRRGYVEMPNVDIISEMVDLIIVNRIYQNIIEELLKNNISIPYNFNEGMNKNIENILNDIKNNIHTQRRITNGNCSPPCSGGSGSAKHQSGCALGGILLHHILPALVLLCKPLFGLAKRQLPRTLYAICLRLYRIY